MPLYDEQAPKALVDLQKWFGSVIATPLTEHDHIAPIAPSGNLISDEAPLFVLPNQFLASHERIQIYNQQYWWRLLTILQDNFPCLLRLFGYQDFNDTIAIPYLNHYRPSDWTLNALGIHLPTWIDQYYHAEDKQLVYDASVLDLSYQVLFFKPNQTPLTSSEDLYVKPLYLQPFIDLLSFSYDLLAFRKELLKHEAAYWLDHPLPELKKNPTYLMMTRSVKGQIVSKPLSEVEWLILKEFQKGATIDTVCEWIEVQSDEFRKTAETHLQNWFGQWTLAGIFCLQQSPH